MGNLNARVRKDVYKCDIVAISMAVEFVFPQIKYNE